MPEDKGNIIPVDVKDEMKDAYLNYAMSVIVGRALPDARDGLKPVQRRILFAMNEMGIRHNLPYKKSARIVGDVLGKYHPHGDMAIYDTLVRMAQPFTYRYSLVDGHGNFGSIDGDPPAAMRYTEVRMNLIAEEMLLDIEKNTVDFIPNFDESMQEPIVLPANFPQLLANGATGIAVGMATNIPPHNLSEIIDATIYLIDHPQSTWRELMEYIPGPDFPTYGLIVGTEGIHDYFREGRGKLILRGDARIEDLDRHRKAIIIREIPYQVNKASLVEEIARLIMDKKITDVSEVRDESDRDGIRVVLELKKNAMNPNFVLNYLYRRTALQTTFGVILLALINGRPEVMGVPDVLRHFIDYRKEVVTRRSKYELKNAEDRIHILEGFLRALDRIDEVIHTIRSSQNVSEAKDRLIQQFQFSDPQAQAILEMRLQRLVALEREKIQEEYKELEKRIASLKDILTHEKSLLNLIKRELLDVKRRFGDARRTRIVDEAEPLDLTDLIAEEDIVITLTRDGYVKRVLLSSYRRQGRGGRGVTGITTKEEDLVSQIAVTTTLHKILFFTSRGRVFQLPAYQLVEMQRQAKGIHLVNLLQLEDGEQVINMIPLKDFGEGKYLFFVTSRGIVKKSDLLEYVSITRRGIRAINLDDGDELSTVFVTNGKEKVLIATAKGYGISFSEEEVRSMGRVSRGVKGITLRAKDRVVGASSLKHKLDLLIISSKGMGKRVKMQNFPVHHRGGKGIILMKFGQPENEVIGVQLVSGQEEILISSQNGTLIRINCNEVSVQGRATRGVTLVRLYKGDLISSFALVE
ncbi:MAG: DNA gyrase subunit A [Atribacter sp.]|jgi:DNA gyrase subunit A|uniref:DNA gyrase subunit A n=1 Tax=Candidatus Atribacter allofermentans TaxID=1852833 RepID=A0A1V5T462_9BACT|nr:MAG: DNA gyrase subunit A [Candidatus Atribacteria bacterium ADurb.Bin276]HOT04931.1 DNA gyrase subunit A [Atribacter sp.]